MLYPFIRNGKWGYIDATGRWVIEPQFERCPDLFDGDYARAYQGKKWGYIDRSGAWVAQPVLTWAAAGGSPPHEVPAEHGKSGVAGRRGQLILPLEYDAIAVGSDSVWVRQDGQLGLFSLTGKWIFEPSVPWPDGQEMPLPTEGGAWFYKGGKWGLLSARGEIVFEPCFEPEPVDDSDPEPEHRPAGLDFQSERAWRRMGKDYCLITPDGKVLAREPFRAVTRWGEGIDLFVTEDGKQGLISWEGKVVLPARFSKITPLHEGRAVIAEHYENEDGGSRRAYGYIDERGEIVVAPGTFMGPGGQTELSTFSEGLAPVWNNSPEWARRSVYDPCAGYIDRSGRVVIALEYYKTYPFSEGLGAALERVPREGMSHESGLWGYLDKTGQWAIAPQFAWTTPFCRGRAWVLKKGCRWDERRWAMIDREGRVLTEYNYFPPERFSTWIGDEFLMEAKNGDDLLKFRWRGELAVVSKGDFLHGLADREGKILVEPVFNRINLFADGVAVAVDSRGRDEKGDVTFTTALLTHQGEVKVSGKYSTISDFDARVAWVSHRHFGPRGALTNEGWGLIDLRFEELTKIEYVKPSWVWVPGVDYSSDQRPQFHGELAAVALTTDYEAFGKGWLNSSWGYIDRSGRRVVWIDKKTAQAE